MEYLVEILKFIMITDAIVGLMLLFLVAVISD